MTGRGLGTSGQKFDGPGKGGVFFQSLSKSIHTSGQLLTKIDRHKALMKRIFRGLARRQSNKE